MNNIRLIDRLDQGKLSRRELNKAFAALGLCMTTYPFAGRQARAAAGEIDYITWAGYEEPVFWQEYIDKHGSTVNYTFQGDEEEALVKVRAGFNADLMHPCTFISGKYRDAGVIQPIDVSRLSRWNDVIPELKTAPGAVIDGDMMFMPFDWLTSSVLYRTDLVDPKYMEEESWGLLFDERYKGKIAMYGGESSVIVAGMMLGFQDDVWAMSDDQLAQCRALLEKQSGLNRFYFIDPASMEQAMKAGEIVAAYGWSFSYLALKNDGVPVRYMLTPKESAISWICGVAWTTVGDADESLIYDFLDAMLSPEAGKYLIDEWGVGHSNMKSFEIASPEIVDELFASDPVAVLKAGNVAAPMSGETQIEYIRMMDDVKTAAGLNE